MKRDEHVNDIPDIEIVDLENETVQDTDFGKSDISDDFEGNPMMNMKKITGKRRKRNIPLLRVSGVF